MKKAVFAICAALLSAAPAPVGAVPTATSRVQTPARPLDARLVALANKYPRGGEQFRAELTALLRANPALASQVSALVAANPNLASDVSYALSNYSSPVSAPPRPTQSQAPFIPNGSNLGGGGGGSICSVSPVTYC